MFAFENKTNALLEVSWRFTVRCLAVLAAPKTPKQETKTQKKTGDDFEEAVALLVEVCEDRDRRKLAYAGPRPPEAGPGWDGCRLAPGWFETGHHDVPPLREPVLSGAHLLVRPRPGRTGGKFCRLQKQTYNFMYCVRLALPRGGRPLRPRPAGAPERRARNVRVTFARPQLNERNVTEIGSPAPARRTRCCRTAGCPKTRKLTTKKFALRRGRAEHADFTAPASRRACTAKPAHWVSKNVDIVNKSR
jgi:hypothetical protein